MNKMIDVSRRFAIGLMVAIAVSAVPVASAASTPVYSFYYKPMNSAEAMQIEGQEVSAEIVGQAKIDLLLAAQQNIYSSAEELGNYRLVAGNVLPHQLIGGAGNAFGRTYQVDFQVHMVHKVRDFNRY